MMPERIVAAQSAEIDGVSGCTFSSTAVKAAAQAAIDQALGTTAAETAEIKMEPGTYTGHGTGYGIIGQLAMDVTVDELARLSRSWFRVFLKTSLSRLMRSLALPALPTESRPPLQMR